MKIRRAEDTERDLTAVVLMTCRFIDETNYRSLIPFNPEAVRAFARRAITEPNMALWLAEDAEIVGMMGMLLASHPISGERMAHELVWWVNPEARAVGVRLFRAAETWARAEGAVAIQMIAPNEHVAEFYRRSGYAAVETVYQRALR